MLTNALVSMDREGWRWSNQYFRTQIEPMKSIPDEGRTPHCSCEIKGKLLLGTWATRIIMPPPPNPLSRSYPLLRELQDLQLSCWEDHKCREGLRRACSAHSWGLLLTCAICEIRWRTSKLPLVVSFQRETVKNNSSSNCCVLGLGAGRGGGGGGWDWEPGDLWWQLTGFWSWK